MALLNEQLRAQIADNASAVDKAELPGRHALPELGQAGLIGADLATSAQVVREIAALDLSVGFTAWATRMTYEYLRRANTPYASQLADQLASGARPGVTGMAGAFKEAAGVGSLDLSAERVDGGYRINGKLGWASNLYEDAVVVTGAKTADDHKFLFAFEAGHEGVTFGKPFGLLGLNATESAWVDFDNAFIPDEQVVTEDFTEYMAGVRPVFVLMQVAECLGVAEAAIAGAEGRFDGVKVTFEQDWQEARERVADVARRQQETIEAVTDGGSVDPVDLLTLRLDAADAAVRAANIEVRVAGGAGYAKSAPASRRYREASFLPVQSPSEAQLRYELQAAQAKQ
ncbi:acyl-CoA dehydrogenase family protein [Corynebacterium tapiri]|uniref:Acyl-CoA dehydrogenase n=1 Tax=Corynebacterium tapiri TaxID=1448266 RepID=A0A5C4U2V0_9CORY|nr:acyl-CoA dehydrogenase family protein [Corynebacterium tapiri]TNL96828.1 acyl-CoA dehydrogenase [Corynebacterium tapiri]